MLTSDQIANALRKKAGNISAAAAALKVTRQTLHNHIKQDESLQKIVTDAREAMVDVAESEALKQIKLGNTAIIIFTLKTLGRNRGYVERQEITGKDGSPLEMIITKGYVTATPDDWDKDKDSTDSNL